jgi:hypothetical protein
MFRSAILRKHNLENYEIPPSLGGRIDKDLLPMV